MNTNVSIQTNRRIVEFRTLPIGAIFRRVTRDCTDAAIDTEEPLIKIDSSWYVKLNVGWDTLKGLRGIPVEGPVVQLELVSGVFREI